MSGCACVRRDAYDCAQVRYNDRRPREEQEPCECSCHDDEPDAYDDALAEASGFDDVAPGRLLPWGREASR